MYALAVMALGYGADASKCGYDRADRLTAISYLGKSTSSEYDAPGRFMSAVLPNGIVMELTYDDANRLTAISATGLAASFVYDALGRRVTKTVNG